MLTLDDAHAANAVHVVGEALGNLSEEVEVDLVDDLEVAGEEALEERKRPLLERLGLAVASQVTHLGKDSVVGVGEGLGDNLPRGVEGDLLLINEDAHELDDRYRGVGVVH